MQLLLQNIIQSIRSLRTQGWQVGISSVSLAVGIICFAFSANWFWAETHYDSFRPHHDEIFVLHKTDSAKISYSSPWLAWAEYNGIKEQTCDGSYEMGFISMMPKVMDFTAEDMLNETALDVKDMDTCAINILGLEILHGEGASALAQSNTNILVSEKSAIKMYGRTDVVGRLITAKGYNTTYTIVGVFASPKGMTNFDYEAIALDVVSDYERNNYQDRNSFAIVRTKDADATVGRLERYGPPGWDGGSYWKLIPVAIYPNVMPDPMFGEIPFIAAYFYQIAFTVISLLLILSAVVNLIMVFTSIYLSRVREYALRRSMGGSAWQNVQWMFVGIMPTLILAAFLAAVGMEWVMALADAPWDTTLIWYFFALTTAAAILLCMVGLLYPVFKMQDAFRSSFLGQGGSGKSHVWLLVVQCAACALLLFFSVGMQNQIRGMLNADMGYDHHNMLRLRTTWTRPEGFDKYYNFTWIMKDLVQEFSKQADAGIIDAIPMETDIFNRFTRNTIWVLPEEEFKLGSDADFDNAGKIIEYIEVPFGMADFFNVKLKDGNKLKAEDENSDQLQVWMNSAAMNLLAPDGVLKSDFYTWSLARNSNFYYDGGASNHWERKKLNIKDVADICSKDFKQNGAPAMFVGVEEFHPCSFWHHDAIYIKYEDGRRIDAETAVRDIIHKFDVPEEQYLLTTFDEYIESYYEKEIFVANLLSALTLFSIVITFAGVFSMLLYSLRLRRRSMAIRRVMGATFRDIFVPTLRPYLIYALIGTVIAYFPAWSLMNIWMAAFHYGEAPGVPLMLAIFCGMAAIITLIVYWQVRLCMKEKPVEILQPES